MNATKNRAERRKKMKVNKKIPPKPIQSELPENIMERPQPQPQQQKQVPLKEMLYELNQQLDNVKGMYNNIILQQHQQLMELSKKKIREEL